MNWKVLLIGGAIAYMVFRDQINAALDSTAPAALPAVAQTPSAIPIAAGLDNTNTKSLIQQAAFKGGGSPDNMLTVDQWNYYYAQVRGIPAPGANAIGFPAGEERVTLDEYWAAMTSAGLGVLRGIASLQGAQPAEAALQLMRRTSASRAWGY